MAVCEDAEPSVRDQSLAEFHDTFKFKQAVDAKDTQDVSGLTPEMLRPFTVVESLHNRNLVKAMDAERNRVVDEKFSLAKGGALVDADLGKIHVSLGVWSVSDLGWSFVKLTW